MQWAATTWHDMYCLFNSQHKARNQILMGSQLKICLICAKKGADDKKGASTNLKSANCCSRRCAR